MPNWFSAGVNLQYPESGGVVEGGMGNNGMYNDLFYGQETS